MSSKFKTHYQEVQIKDLNDSVLRARVLGKIIEVNEGNFMLDDGTGVVKVVVNEDFSVVRVDLSLGKDVIIFGKVIKIDDSYHILADIIIGTENINVKQYRKVMDVWKKYRGNGQ